MRRSWTAALLVFLGALSALKMLRDVDNDLFWQLKDGERIVREGRLPLREEYSYTVPGRLLPAAEWLSEALTYLVFSAAGYGGLVAFNAALFMLMFALLLRLIRKRLPPASALCLLCLAAFAFLNFYAARAQNWTFLFTALFLRWADSWEGGDEKAPWAMAAVLLPWANLHGGFMVGWAILVAVCLRRVWETRRSSSVAPWALGTILCCVHPNGAGALAYPLCFMAASPPGRPVLEWRAVDFGDVTAAPYMILLAFLLWFGLRGARTRFPWPALTLALTVLALRGRKLLPEFTLASVALLARRLGAPVPSRIRRVLGAGALLALGMSSWVVSRGLSGGVLTDWERGYPREAVRMIAERYPDRKLFHNYDWGGYLVYKLYPRGRVFIDGRMDRWGLFFGDYAAILEEKPGWRTLLDKYGITVALLRPTDRLCQGLSADPAWKIVYGDARAVLFAR